MPPQDTRPDPTPKPQQPSPFTLVGAQDAAVCVDGVCAVPSARSEAEEEPTGEATGTAYNLVTDVKEP